MFNNVTGENVAIGETAGTAEIRVMGGLSTMNDATAEHYSGVSWSMQATHTMKSVTVMIARLDEVLARNNIPHEFDLMVIDVEGCEETIVSSLLASPWRPRVLIVELVDQHPDFALNVELTGSSSRARNSLAQAGYRERFVDSFNTIFSLDPGFQLTDTVTGVRVH
jgi:FkbM family methyltransferase